MSLPKFTPQVQKKIVAYVEAGNFVETACAASGISYNTFKRWMKQGRSKDPKDRKYRAFRAAIKAARAHAELTAVQNIRAAGLDPKHWQANSWFLERSASRERWRPPTNKVETNQGAPSPAQALAQAEARAADYKPPEPPPGHQDEHDT